MVARVASPAGAVLAPLTLRRCAAKEAIATAGFLRRTLLPRADQLRRIAAETEKRTLSHDVPAARLPEQGVQYTDPGVQVREHWYPSSGATFKSASSSSRGARVSRRPSAHPHDPIAAALSASVDAGEFAGAATLVWHAGDVIHAAAVGWRDVAAHVPLARDTLFRIASMTKPITSTLALMLVEEGKIALGDSITRWAPEFAEMRVLRSPDGGHADTDPAQRPITFEDLLTHRSGLTYGDFHTGPIAGAYAKALGGAIDSVVTPDAWVAGLARLPLIDQPGAAFHYGCSTDLLGLLIARIEGAPLGDVLRARILDPLGMQDTGFTVPKSKRHRRAGAYGFDEGGRLTALVAVPGGAALPERPDDMAYVSGGQGLWSTVDDYLAFARMFVGRGAVDGVVLLRPETVALMASNRLSDSQRATARMFGMPIFASGHGFGLGVAVVTDPEQAHATPCGGGRGAVGWPGAYGGWWRADPSNDSVLIFLAHQTVRPDQLRNGIGLGVYEAIERFQELASAKRA